MTQPSKHNVASIIHRLRYGLQAKALLAPTVLIVLMTVAFVTIFLSSERQSSTLTRTFEYAMVKNATVADVRTKTVNIHSEMYRMMSLLAAKIDRDQLGQIGKQVTKKINHAKMVMDKLKEELQLSSNEISQIDRVVDALKAYDASSKDAINAVSSGLQIAVIFMVGVEQNFNKLQAELEKLDEMVSVVQYGDILEDTKAVQTLVILLLAIAAILGVVLTVITMRHVTRPITDITGSMKLLASGNTDVEISPLDRKDEIGDMARALAVFKDNAIELKEELIARKEAELAMRKAMEQAEQANAAKSQFLAAMSHDFRTPLNAIIGFSDLMRNQIFGALTNKEYEEYAEDIHYSGTLLLSLINDILDISKVEAGKYAFNEKTINVNKQIQFSFRQLSAMAKEFHQTLTSQIAPDLPYMRGDERLLMQILNNLISNAIKFNQGKGSITVTAQTDNNNAITISVIDTGIGLSEKGIATALKPFEQAHEIRSSQPKGTGLGLYLCSKFMEMFGGSLKIESEFGTGTTVSIYFPPERTIFLKGANALR